MAKISLDLFIPEGPGNPRRFVNDKLRDIVSVLDFIPASRHEAIKNGTSTYDCTSDITTAFAAHNYVDFGAEGWLFNVSTFTIPAGKSLVTRGRGPTFQQIAGQSANTRMIVVGGSNVTIGDCKLIGNIATDTGEQMFGILCQANATTGDIENVLIGNIRGQDIRGDLVYCGHNVGYMLSNYHVGHLYGDNIYRNIMSAVSGTGGSVKTINSGRVGFCALDIEPNAGVGTGTNFRAGFVKGRMLGLNAQTAADAIDGIELGVVDLSPSHSAQSSVPYEDGVAIEDGLLLRNLRRASIKHLKVEGFNRCGIFTTYNVGELGCQMLEIGSLYMRNCSITDTTYNAYVAGADVTRLKVGYVDVAISTSGKRAFSAISGSTIDSVLADIQSSGIFLYDSDDVLLKNVECSGAGGFFIHTCNRVSVEGGSYSGARLTVTSEKCSFADLSITTTTALYSANTEEHTFDRCTINGTYYEHLGGPGGTVTQAANKGTGVTLDTRNGEITMEATASIAAGAIASFTLTNNKILANDIVRVQRKSGGTAGAYRVWCDSVAAGSCVICVENRTAGGLAEAVVLQFSVLNSATT